MKSQLKKLRKSPDILQQYDLIIKEQLEAGIIERVKTEEIVDRVSYLPHQPVIREEAETTKIRIVYDALCKDRETKTSLNDCLHIGPSLIPLMFHIMPVIMNDDC